MTRQCTGRNLLELGIPRQRPEFVPPPCLVQISPDRRLGKLVT